MKKGIVFLLGLLLFLPALATATVLTFDDLNYANSPIVPNGYGGLDWNNMYFFPPALYYSGTGYNMGIVSGTQVAYIPTGATTATISKSGGVFDFNGTYFSSALSNNNLLTVTGYLNGVQTYQSQVTLNVVPAQYYVFDFLGINSLTLTANSWLAMDNFTYNQTPVPEPSTMLLLGSGLMGLVGYGRMRLRK